MLLALFLALCLVASSLSIDPLNVEDAIVIMNACPLNRGPITGTGLWRSNQRVRVAVVGNEIKLSWGTALAAQTGDDVMGGAGYWAGLPQNARTSFASGAFTLSPGSSSGKAFPANWENWKCDDARGKYTTGIRDKDIACGSYLIKHANCLCVKVDVEKVGTAAGLVTRKTRAAGNGPQPFPFLRIHSRACRVNRQSVRGHQVQQAFITVLKHFFDKVNRVVDAAQIQRLPSKSVLEQQREMEESRKFSESSGGVSRLSIDDPLRQSGFSVHSNEYIPTAGQGQMDVVGSPQQFDVISEVNRRASIASHSRSFQIEQTQQPIFTEEDLSQKLMGVLNVENFEQASTTCSGLQQQYGNFRATTNENSKAPSVRAKIHALGIRPEIFDAFLINFVNAPSAVLAGKEETMTALLTCRVVLENNNMLATQKAGAESPLSLLLKAALAPEKEAILDAILKSIGSNFLKKTKLRLGIYRRALDDLCEKRNTITVRTINTLFADLAKYVNSYANRGNKSKYITAYQQLGLVASDDPAASVIPIADTVAAYVERCQAATSLKGLLAYNNF